MEKEKHEIIFQPEAIESIFNIYLYITNRGYPDTAEKFYNELYDFGYKLNIFPEKYPLCRFPKLARRNLRCAVFHKNYIFVYKTFRQQLIIYNVLHTKTLK